MIRIGLTGGIGMGKSTVAEMFAALGVPVWDADAAVHRLYAADGAGAAAIAQLCPLAVGSEGVDRRVLRAEVIREPALLKLVEAAIHPLVAADRASFLAQAAEAGAEAALCDIPLLFETGAERHFDKVVVVTAPAEVQRSRVLARPGMTEAALETILAKQMPDAEKRVRADLVIDTSESLEATQTQVIAALKKIKREMAHA
ncbi:MAG: dephospho-CoA kinase [Pikeienuella sp.]